MGSQQLYLLAGVFNNGARYGCVSGRRKTMICPERILIYSVVGVIFSALAGTNSFATNAQPYAPIIERNAFGLLPIVTPPPEPPAKPLPKVLPDGITTVLGRPEVLFKVEDPENKQTKPESYILCEGEMQDDVKVVRIDVIDRVVTFENHGVTQVIPVDVPATTGDSKPSTTPAHVFRFLQRRSG